ncbi:MAG: protein kinase domain-containing protein [Myxococcaceae bacterium]
MRLTPGTRVGPYEVVALLGAGGMAEVYRARDTRLGRDVALKVVSEALVGALGPTLEREARVASALSHPNVVALYDVGLEDGKRYFVTELLRGESLRERLAKGVLPLGTALEWASQMAQGLAAAHECGIVHRDLKPENVFITREGHLKLIDFGIAQFAHVSSDSDTDVTLSPSGSRRRAGMVFGTPGYMSPEQMEGEPVDARTDFFSLGAVLYEMLSGRRAFPKGSAVDSGYATLHSEPDALPPTVPAEVAQLVRRCMEKAPEQRFQSARDLAFNLQLLAASTGPVSPRAPLRTRTLTPLWRRWRWRLALALAVLAVAGSTVAVMLAGRPSIPKVEQVTFRLGRVSAARFSPEGRVVYSAALGEQPLELFSQPRGSPDAQSLGVHNADLLAISPKGEMAVVLEPSWYDRMRKGTLALVPSAGGTPRAVATNVSYADWSPTNELAIVREVGGKRRLEFPTGTPLFESAGYLFNPRVSPHGDSVAFFHWTPSGAVELAVVDRRGVVQVFAAADENSGLAWVPSGDELWFSFRNAIWASKRGASPRLVYQGVSEMRLEDISKSGAVLVNAQATRRELSFLPPGPLPGRSLSWLDYNHLGAISEDGSKVFFCAYPRGEDTAFVRATDGSLAVELGRGDPHSVSPDGRWVVSVPEDVQQPLSLLPIGSGTPRTVLVQGVMVERARWLHDGDRLVLMGRPPDDKVWHLYLVPLATGIPVKLSEGVHGAFFEVSRDDQLVAARDLQDTLTLYPVDGGAPVPLPELGKDAIPVGWNAQGNLWVRPLREVPGRLRRYDVQNHRVLEERIISPTDMTGLTVIGQVCITPDDRSIAFDYIRILGYLYRLDGLLPSAP